MSADRTLLEDRATQDMAALRDRYLDLLEAALTHRLYSGTDSVEFSPRGRVRRTIHKLLRDRGFVRISQRPDLDERRLEGRDWPLFAQTMIGAKRLANLRTCVETVLDEEIPGDLIEAGVWRGGASIFMRGILEAYGDRNRRVWLADSFQGLPKADPERYPADAETPWHTADHLAVSLDQVRRNFEQYGLLDRVEFLKGWFKDTLPTVTDRSWALVRLDGDMYESTMDGLQNLYAGLVPGGFMIIDDYSIDSCQEAVTDFRREHGIDDPLEKIDWSGVYWRRFS